MDISTTSSTKSNFSNTNSFQNSFFNSSKKSSFIDSVSLDSYIDEIKKDTKYNNHYKLSEIIKNLDYDICSKSDDNIYDHVKKCNNCKKKLLKFLNNDILDDKLNKKNNKDIKKNFLNKNNIKESIIMIMIGIFIIILLDLIMNRK